MESRPSSPAGIPAKKAPAKKNGGGSKKRLPHTMFTYVNVSFPETVDPVTHRGFRQRVRIDVQKKQQLGDAAGTKYPLFRRIIYFDQQANTKGISTKDLAKLAVGSPNFCKTHFAASGGPFGRKFWDVNFSQLDGLREYSDRAVLTKVCDVHELLLELMK